MIGFEPVALERALGMVRSKHPHRGAVERELPEGLLARLRAALRKTPFEGLLRLAAELDRDEIKGCFRIAVVDRKADVAAKAARVVQSRPRIAFLVEGWEILCREYPHALLEQLARDLLDVFGEPSFANKLGRRAWTVRWLDGETVGEGLLSHYEQIAEQEGLDTYLSRGGLDAEHGMYWEGWRQLFSQGRRSALQRQTPERLHEQLVSTKWNAEERVLFGRNYLEKLGRRDAWYDPTLEWVRAHFGDPVTSDSRSSHEHLFWHPISEPTKIEFRRWTLRKRIERFFEGVRAEFWRDYTDGGLVLDVKEILAEQGFMLDFGRFGVVEFKKIGHAAYVYPAPAFRALWMTARGLKTPDDFKHKERTLHTWKWSGRVRGRILHYEGWQDKASDLLARHLGGAI